MGESLVQAFREGDPAAFATLIQRCERRVRVIVARHFASPFAQEEAMQDIWVHIYTQREKVDPMRHLELDGWVATLARNRCLDLLRALKRREGKHDDIDDVPIGVEPHAATSMEVFQLTDAAEAFAARQRPQWREFFVRHFMEGQKYPEIARDMKITRLRCRYMKRVLAEQARKDEGLLAALAREQHAP